MCFQGPANIPPPILEDFYNQGEDDDGDDHEHEDEQRPYTATNSDGSPLLVCIQRIDDVTGKEAGVSHVALSRPIPTPAAWYSGWILVC